MNYVLFPSGRPDSAAHLQPSGETGHRPPAAGKRSVSGRHHQLRLHTFTPGSQGGTQRRGHSAARPGSEPGNHYQGDCHTHKREDVICEEEEGDEGE